MKQLSCYHRDDIISECVAGVRPSLHRNTNKASLKTLKDPSCHRICSSFLLRLENKIWQYRVMMSNDKGIHNI